MKRWVFLIILFCCSIIFGQEESVWMHANIGQWDGQIAYRVNLAMGKMYIENDGFTFSLYEAPESHNHDQDAKHEHQQELPEILHAHAVRTKFIGSTWSGEKVENGKSGFYSNYFVGKDQSKWRSEVYSYDQVKLLNFYSGIDMELDGQNGKLKYSFNVAPQFNPSVIQMSIDGASKAYIDNEGNLHITTSLGEIIEQKPIAWNVATDGNRNVDVQFVLNKNVVSYHFPNGYNSNEILVIDPSLIFSSFSGATSDNWGMTATPGPNGEMYGGGISFGIGYPTTSGAYNVSYSGGISNGSIPGYDVAISKFTSSGNALLFSTYFGGGGNELPESMITNDDGELFILGITSSTNFPISAGAYDGSFNGGPSVTGAGTLTFAGTDIYVAKFNETGTALLGSTYLGGSSSDGINASPLSYNYGDEFRGEIILDALNNVYVASHSSSSDFPVTNGSTLGGTQSAIISKLNDDLSSLTWSTYFGGTGIETGNSIDITAANELFVAGATTSPNLPFTGIDQTFSGTFADGYVIKINGNTGALMTGTYMGEVGYDQVYFVRTDIDGDVYVYGQSENAWAITPGCYGNPNSGQFLRKFPNNLSSVNWTTMIGSGSGNPEISPTAFMISQCYDIFITGWGGVVNTSNSQATGSSSIGFPTTPNAYQAGTNGSNFYLGILTENAQELLYGSFLGGTTSSSNHVDGGTSRFDKSGTVYHAVCAACGGSNNGFTTTPGAWSTSNLSPNCNMAVFKFELGIPYSIGPNATICQGESHQLTSSGGVSFSWTPAPSLNNAQIANPIATPMVTTVYYVEMDFNEGCAIEDSIVVEVIVPPSINLPPGPEICSGESVQITATSNGDTYSWSPTNNMINPSSSTVTVAPSATQYYYCTVSNQCFSTTDSILITVRPAPNVIVNEDTTICVGDNTILTAIGGMAHSWVVHPTLTVLNTSQAQVTPIIPTYYYATGTDIFGCQGTDSVLVDFIPIPSLLHTPDTVVCTGESAQLYVSGGISYSWTPSGTLSNPNSSNPIASPIIPTTYTVTATYATSCEVQDSLFIDIIDIPIPIIPDSVFACVGVGKNIQVAGANSYEWSPSTYLNLTSGPFVVATVTEDIIYTVSFTNQCGTTSATVDVIAITPHVEAFNDTIVCPGFPVALAATGGLLYDWSPATGILFSQNNGQNLTVAPPYGINYRVVGLDEFGCYDTAFVRVDLFPDPNVIVSANQIILPGETVQLQAWSTDEGSYEWSPSAYLSCVDCPNPFSTPANPIDYQVVFIDTNGCADSAYVSIVFDATLWIPNTFTPDGTGKNDVFRIVGENVKTLELHIFNRWGELIKSFYSMQDYWDGTFNGNKCQDGTYTWKLVYTNQFDEVIERVGHINLIR